MLENGLDSIPNGLTQLSRQSQAKVDAQSTTFKTVSLVIGIISVFVNFIIVPIVYPMLVHYERLAYYILHSMNKLTKKFLENEVKCCNQLFNYMGKKHGSGLNDKNSGLMMKKPEERLENKQLMKVNPKLSKYVLEQQRKKKGPARDERRTNRSRRSRQSGQGDEEEKITVEDLDHARRNH